MAKKKELKDGNDYPLLGYRVQPHIKESVTSELEEVLKICNSLRKGDRHLKKNELFVRALKKGLEKFKETKGRDI